MDVVCFCRKLSIPDDLVSVQKSTISVFFSLKLCHEMEGRCGFGMEY
jgi:hypothetical protein